VAGISLMVAGSNMMMAAGSSIMIWGLL
jgi:hypothetical protein